jgi:transposase
MAAYSQDQKMFVGVDVYKDRLDIHVHPAGESLALARSVEGVDELVKTLKARDIAVVGLEATGGLELMVIAALQAAGLPVVVLNPKNVRGYATALGLHAKTDGIDAHVIARFVADVKPEVRPLPDAETQALSEFMGRRRQLVQMITAEKNRALRSGSSKALQKSIGRVIDALERELARLDGDIDRQVKSSPLWLEKEALLSSVPGIGKIIARTLLAEMPELGRLDRRQIASLAGLAPWARQSGSWRGKNMIGGGRSVPRTVLFLGAMVAKQHNPDLNAFGLRLLNLGKPKKVVIIAVARKLLTILNAIIRDMKPWSPKTA